MEDLSLHILDVVENSIEAGATRIEIAICEDRQNDLMWIRVADNGRGMDQTALRKARDPFFTTRTVRRVGLGLSLFEEAARAAGGGLKIESQPGVGTAVTASFQRSHIDRKPLGNMAETLLALILAHPEIEFAYTHQDDGARVSLDTTEIRSRLGSGLSSSPEAIAAVRKSLEKIGEQARRRASREEA
jgi:anti-sigma regulatory factor (Ser/Thr protein kinase)